MSSPNGIAFDASGDLWVTDSLTFCGPYLSPENPSGCLSYPNRVMEFTVPIDTGEGANVIIGQPDSGQLLRKQRGGKSMYESEYESELPLH